MKSSPRSLILPGAVFAAALALRLVHLSDLSALPLFDHPVMDQQYHDTWAREELEWELPAPSVSAEKARPAPPRPG